MSRVLLVLNSAWNIYNFRLGLLRGLEEDGHEIEVAAPQDAYASRIPYPFHPIPMNPKGVNPVEDLLLLARLTRLYRKLHPDVILHYTPKPNIYGSMAAGIAGIPSICNIAGLGTGFEGKGPLALVLRGLYRTAMRFPRTVFFQNGEDRATLTQMGIVRSEQADRVPGSGVPLDRLVPPPFRRGRPFVFLFVSRLLRQKGIEDFVQAAMRVRETYPDTEFRIAGFLDVSNPGAVSATEMQVWVDSGHVRYLGPSDDVPSLMREADCVVLPTYYREGVPRVLLEACALARPIIATHVAGCKEILVDGGNGFVCRPRDPAHLAEQMIRMLRLNDDQLQKLGVAAREKVEREFDERIVIRKYADAIRRAI